MFLKSAEKRKVSRESDSAVNDLRAQLAERFILGKKNGPSDQEGSESFRELVNTSEAFERAHAANFIYPDKTWMTTRSRKGIVELMNYEL